MADSEYKTFEAAREAARLAVGKTEKLGLLKEDRRASAVDPALHQLLRGLCLEICADGSLRLWTPWGEWTFCLTDIRPGKPLPKIPKLELLPFEDRQENQRGGAALADVFAIHQAGNLILPYPRLSQPPDAADAEDARRRWRVLTMRFFGQLGPIL